MFLARPERVEPGTALAVKDLFDTAGLVTTYGSAIFRDHVPEHTAEAVVRLEATGFANVGKTNLHEFAYGITSHNPHFGDVPNPIAPERVAGGSSGGSAAALAAGLADAALGSDSGGSIRIPAACCAVVGFKPSFGLVPMTGCFPLAPSFDHAGPMARDVGGCLRMMEALSPQFQRTELDSTARLEVGIAWTDCAEPLVRARVTEAAGLLGARPVELPDADGIGPAFMREVADTHRELFARHRRDYGPNVAAKIERCLAVSDREYGAACERRRACGARFELLFREFDLFVTPTIPCVAPPASVDELDVRERMVSMTLPLNAVGAPALALPCGAAEDGLPASIQLVGPPGADGLVLAAGVLLERALGAD